MRYDIVHAGGTTTAPLQNQQANNGAWVSLGSYSFAAGTAGSVLVRNDAANGYVIADAVRFVAAGALPAVAIIAAVPKTDEPSATPAAFTVFRESAGASDLAVRVNFAGTATASTDYKSLPGIITIPAGSLSASVLVQAFPDNIIEGSETVIASLATDPAYAVASPSSATVTIYDPPFDRWKAANFTPAELTDPAISDNAADTDHDGRGNFLEFALNTDPRHADASGLPALGWQNPTQLRLYYARSEASMNFEVQQSASLASNGWTHSGITSELYDAASGLFYQAATVVPGETSKFLRLQIIGP